MKKIVGLIVFSIALVTVQAQEPGSGNCLNYNGTSNYVNCGTDNLFNFARTDAFSIQGWIKTNQASGISTVAARIVQTGVFPGWAALVNSGKIRIQLVHNNAANQKVDVETVNAFNDGEWHYVTYTYDGSSQANGIRIYVDGVEQTLTTIANNLSNSIQVSRPLTIGGRTSSQFFDGDLDEIRIWGRILTQAEIRAGMCRKLDDCADPDLIGYWRFDEGMDNTCTGGQDVCDASCNNNHGIKL